jgi:hypothetical protein
MANDFAFFEKLIQQEIARWRGTGTDHGREKAGAEQEDRVIDGNLGG